MSDLDGMMSQIERIEQGDRGALTWIWTALGFATGGCARSLLTLALLCFAAPQPRATGRGGCLLEMAILIRIEPICRTGRSSRAAENVWDVGHGHLTAIGSP